MTRYSASALGLFGIGGTSWEAFLGGIPLTQGRVTLNKLPRVRLAWGLVVKVITAYCVGERGKGKREKGGGTTPTYYDSNQYVHAPEPKPGSASERRGWAG